MAKILCAYSGVEFEVPHFAGINLTERELKHPVFSLSTQRLLGLADTYMDGRMSYTENYLYYLALFNTTELVRFSVPAIQTGETQGIIAQTMDKLLFIVNKLHCIGAEYSSTRLSMPQFNIGPETKDLSNTPYWCEVWNENYQDYLQAYKTTTERAKLAQMEAALEVHIKNHNRTPADYARQLADWAARAGSFYNDEQFVADSTAGDKPIKLCDYWRKMIIMCAKDENIFSLHDGDLSELIDHCEETIGVVAAGIQAHTLLTVLRTAQRKKHDYLNLGDINIGANGLTFRILDASASVEDANKLALIDSAPATEPKLLEYPNRLAYLKAKMKWDLAQQYKNSTPPAPDTTTL